MSFDREYIAQKLDRAYQSGKYDQNFVVELGSALSELNLADGVDLDFATNERAFRAAVDILAIDSLVHDDGPMHIHQAIVHNPSQDSFIGKSIPALKRLSLVDALEAMQIDHWKVGAGWYNIPELRIPPNHTITSMLLLAHTKYEDGERLGDIEKSGILLSASYFSGALLLEDEITYHEESIANIIKASEEDHSQNMIVDRFANFIADNGLTMMLARSTFSISVGKLSRGRNMLGGAGTVSASKVVEIQNPMLTS